MQQDEKMKTNEHQNGDVLSSFTKVFRLRNEGTSTSTPKTWHKKDAFQKPTKKQELTSVFE